MNKNSNVLQHNTNEVLELIQENCGKYVQALKKCDKYRILIRGTFDSIDSIKLYNHNLIERTPRDMPIEIHDQINAKFEAEFKWKIRNGVFCFGYDLKSDKTYQSSYGINYFIFPKDDFEFIYSPRVFDLWMYFKQNGGEINDLINDLFFLNDNLNNALKSGDEESGFSNEISLKTTEYYLVNMKFHDKIIEMIWD